MYKRSALLEYLLNHSKGEGDTSTSVSLFFADVLKLLRNGISPSNFEDTVIGEVSEDYKNIQKLFETNKVNVPATLEKLDAYCRQHEKTVFDWVYFNKVLLELQFRQKPDRDDCVITAFMVCDYLFKSMPAEISSVMVYTTDASKLQDSSKQSTDNSKLTTGLDDEDMAELDRIVSEILEEDDDDDDDFDLDDEDSTEDQSENLVSDIMSKVENVRAALAQKVFGQNHAISAFVSGLFRAELTANVFENRDKPRATFLFAGPPGVGKTYLSEQAALALGLPFRRFDMSEYSEKEANLEFAGSDKVYKNGSKGNVTGFVAENPKCVLLFDEIEKAHLNVIYLFLQILDAGRLRDNYTDEEVSFTDAVIIFTTNVGKRMYEDESINLLTASKKTVLRALASELNPVTNTPLFPPAICSRFASGNVVMFNRMGTEHLLTIAKHELDNQFDAIKKKTCINIGYSDKIPYALLYAEGGKADARTIKARSIQFAHDELYELFRLMQSQNSLYDTSRLQSINFEVSLPADAAIRNLFESNNGASVLIFASKSKCAVCKTKMRGVDVLCADSLEAAKNALESNEVSVVLCDLNYQRKNHKNVLNSADMDSLGMDFFRYVTHFTAIPVYLLGNAETYGKEELDSLYALGAEGVLDFSHGKSEIVRQLKEILSAIHLRKAMLDLARANKVLSFGTEQKIDKDDTRAIISLYDFDLSTAVDAEDNEGILNDISKPNVRFSDVIGAEDAKEELKYFVEYLKEPLKYIKKGIKAPKGILLYGPPGTGKTLLAKAMAGESDVTFFKAEGNQFLKSMVGQGPESVHKLFSTARKYAPAIVFIDEIDAIAKNRQSGVSSASNSDILTSFLTEMDGFNTDDDRPVFVLAATNFSIDESGGIDPALLRRFDRRIYIDLPNREERTLFLNQKIAKIKNHAVDKNMIDNIALRSAGSSLADLDSMLELALRNVIRSREGNLTNEILEDAFETFNSGEVKKWDENELERTARHEAGHAVVCWATGEKPSYLTVVARASHGGYMQHGDKENKGIYTKEDLLNRVRTALGGRAAEILYYGEENGLSSGVSGDLKTATAIVQAMICDYGMDSEFGLCSVDISDVANSSYHSQLIKRINEILKEQLSVAKNILSENRRAVDCLVRELLSKNALKGEEIEQILKSEFADKSLDKNESHARTSNEKI